MSEGYTPGLLRYEVDEILMRLHRECGHEFPFEFDILGGPPEDSVVVAKTNGYPRVSDKIQGCGGDPEANARRLVAAWNSVQNIPTAALEGGGVAALRAAAEAVLDGLNARVVCAAAAGEPVPEFDGAAALHAAILGLEGDRP